MKRFAPIILALALALCAGVLFGCSNSSSDEPNYVDDQFVQDIAKSFESRSAYIDKNGPGHDTESYRACVQCELDVLDKYRNALFEDSALQEIAISYLNALDQQYEAASLCDSDIAKFSEQWGAAYDKRTQLLEQLVNDYGLTVNEKYQSALDDMLTNAKAVNADESAEQAAQALADKANLQPVYNEYGFVNKFTGEVTNDTGVSFDNISFNVMYYDEAGTRISEGYTHADKWNDGETIVLEAYCDSSAESAASTKVEVHYYTVAK